jgi:hypothetical protein
MNHDIVQFILLILCIVVQTIRITVIFSSVVGPGAGRRNASV